MHPPSKNKQYSNREGPYIQILYTAPIRPYYRTPTTYIYIYICTSPQIETLPQSLSVCMYVATCLFKRTRSHGLVYTTITKSAPKRPPCCHVWCLSVRKRPLRHSLTLVSVDNATKFGKKRVMNPATETPPVLPRVFLFHRDVFFALRHCF